MPDPARVGADHHRLNHLLRRQARRGANTLGATVGQNKLKDLRLQLYKVPPSPLRCRAPLPSPPPRGTPEERGPVD
jgi:hypothetical protein